MTGFLVALKFLTRIPAPPLNPEKAGDLARGAPWMPLVGALVGAYVAVTVGLCAQLGGMAGPWIGALLGLIVWVIVTGGLHLEGLGDVADGLGASHGNADRFREVARDPHIGGFGTIAIALQLIAKVVLLAALASKVPIAAVVLTSAWARWGTLALGRFVPPLGEGLASRLASGIETRVVVLEAVVLAVLSLWVAPVLLVAILVTLAFAVYWHLRLGGITGDCHGASIEITESVLLFVLVLA